MNTYTINQPSILGILSDDHIYFNGIHKPKEFFIIRDGGSIEKGNILILENYLSDIHDLFLKKLEIFYSNLSDDEHSIKLQALLQEIIKVKKLIENAKKEDIIDR